MTNQRGVGLGLLTEEQLCEIHEKMITDVIRASGTIHKIYYCKEIDSTAECRKPNIEMGLRAKIDFPEINFSKSVMVGDSISDMEFGKKLGMKTVLLGCKGEISSTDDVFHNDSLLGFCRGRMNV